MIAPILSKFPKCKERFLRPSFLIILLVLLCVAIFVAISRSSVVRETFPNLRLPRVVTVSGSRDAALVFSMGNYYFGGSADYDAARAEEFFRRTITIDPSYPGAHYQLGRVLFIKGDLYAAERELDEEIKLHPDFWRSHYVRALIRGYRHDFTGAITEFEEFLRYKPESWAAYNDLAWVYFRMGEYEKVKEVAKSGLRYAPDNPWLNNSLGIALMNVGDNEGARAALSRAQKAVMHMTLEEWGRAYPGNDPRVYGQGLEAMRSSIKENLALLAG